MAGMKARNRSLPINGLNNGAQQVNGLYVHSSPPKALQVNPRAIRQWIRSADFSQLEQLVLDGQGHKLIGEFSSDPRVRSFIKQVPLYMTKISELHKAITKGDLKQLQKALEFKTPDMKNIAMSKNHAGAGLLHKAVYYGYLEIVKFLASNFPQMINMKDKEGKTPLHYSGASDRAGRIWSFLTGAGADVMILDSRNKVPLYYMEHSNELQMAEDKTMPQVSISSAPPDLIIKPSNIRIWIHDRDLGKLQQVIWEGHGGKLRVETSNNPRVRRFLEGVPHILNVIKDVHSAVVHDDLEDFVKKSSDPVPVKILGSKDVNGLNPLHKASGLGHQKIAQAILERNPNLIDSVDHEGRTPLHYAAALRDNNAMYNFLIANRADEMAFDKNGKMPSYYKTNSKELNTKVLEVIPEAPRTTQQFPQTWDWMLFYPGGSAPSTITSLPRDVSQTNEGEPPKKTSLEQTEEAKPPVESYNRKPEKEDVKLKEKQEVKQLEVDAKLTEKVENAKEEEVSVFEEKKEATQVKETQIDDKPGEDYDIWTNEDANHGDDDKEDKGSTEDEGYPKEEDSGAKDQIESDSERQDDEVFHGPQTPENQSVESLNDSGLHESSDNRGKTEREIAEERQRLLDEGLLKINSEDSDVNEEDKVNEVIKTGDMEKLASMVLNGEGDKLLGKTAKNEEIQTFLDNLPTYMAKITAVHRAAKGGSLKELHGALDRRRFAIAKESSDSLGATPLHVALLFQNSQIVKYLAGRFPETLNVKDKYGRTPLHYAAIIPDNNYFYDTLLDLGANQNIRDDDGHTPKYYQENPGMLTIKKLLEEFNTRDVSSALTDPSVHNIEPQISFDEGIPLSKSAGGEDKDKDEGNGNDISLSNFNTTDRDEYGQSILHFASARAHGRGGLFQLIQDSSVNLGYRDELYRTARDIALQANIPENVNEIDRFVISLAARGEKEKLIQLFLEGYNHILDMEDDEDNNIVTLAENKNNEKTVTFLKAIPILEEKRECVHRAIRAGEEKLVQDIITDSKNGRLIVIGKNSTGRCSLHISVLCQQKEITEFIAQKFPETLKIGDNLERTALHYSMGVEEVETLSKILIQCGAKRVVKDLKGRQPTYYFMNRTEILKLQEEENILKV